MKIIYLALAFSLLLNCNTTKSVEQQTFSHKIDELVQTKNPRPFNGVVVIAKDDKIIYNKVYGYSNIEKKSKLNLNDYFSSMSIAKQITATLVMLEVEKGTINLNMPIKTYLKDLNYDWINKVTVNHLLNNSSGIDSWELKKELLFEPGTQFKYSNMGYGILGRILESTTGKSYEQLVIDFFTKYGMKNSFYPNLKNQKKIVNSYQIKEDGMILVEKFPYQSDFYSGSHLILTATDLAKWNQLLHNGKILKDEMYQKMISYSIKNAHPLFGEKEIGYGYGLRINDNTNIFEIGHTGFSPSAGFTAVNLYYPKNKVSVIVLENIATDNFDIAYYYEEEIRKIMIKSNFLNISSKNK